MTEESWQKELSFLNVKNGIYYAAGNKELYLEVLRMYLEEQRIDMLEESYRKKDWKNYRIQAHALKGTSRSIGADHLFQQAMKLENAAKALEAGDAAENGITDLHEAVLQEYRELLEQLARCISRV